MERHAGRLRAEGPNVRETAGLLREEEVLFGQEAGPRFGSFAAIFGVRETAALMRKGLAGELLNAA
jgi:lysyl-tRNA synthetase class 1